LRICAVSDLHGFLPEIPDCDALVIAGDIVAASHDQREEMQSYVRFGHWLTEIVCRGIIPVGIAGNHDFLLRDDERFARALPWVYLLDQAWTHPYRANDDVTFFGTPWQPWFGGWAFNAPEVDPGEEFLHSKFDQIPADTDVLIAHGPPAGILDRVGGRHVGSNALSKNIQRVMPKLVVCGHIHHCYGVEQVEGVTIANASVTAVENGNYVLRNPPLLFDI
jgi:Icc-related predicted phosphoesterase